MKSGLWNSGLTGNHLVLPGLGEPWLTSFQKETINVIIWVACDFSGSLYLQFLHNIYNLHFHDTIINGFEIQPQLLSLGFKSSGLIYISIKILIYTNKKTHAHTHSHILLTLIPQLNNKIKWNNSEQWVKDHMYAFNL